MIVKTVTLRCDHCGQVSNSHGFETLQLARDHAKKLGWVREIYSPTEKHDVCSRCRVRETTQL